MSFSSSASLLRDHQLPHLFSVFTCSLPSVLFFASLGILPLLVVSLQNVPIFLFPSLLNVSLVFLGLYVHLSLYHLSLLLFCLHLPNSFSFFFRCTFVSERLSLSLSLFSKPLRQIDARTLFTCQADD
jgi:hypothetical protein